MLFHKFTNGEWATHCFKPYTCQGGFLWESMEHWDSVAFLPLGGTCLWFLPAQRSSSL